VMPSLVVDTSVAYKWLSDYEEDSIEEAEALLDAHVSGRVLLVAPETLHVELANALRYSRFEPDDVVALVEDLESFRVELLEVTIERLGDATTLAYQHRLTVYDALFLQLAEELACPLVTADRRAFKNLDTPVEIRLI